VSKTDSNQGEACHLAHPRGMWKPILSAPFDSDLELAVLDEDGEHALVFPCMKTRKGWRNAATGAYLDIHPTHWRDWVPDKTPADIGNSISRSP